MSFFLHHVPPILTPSVSSSQSFEDVNCVFLDSTQAKVDLKNNNKCKKKKKIQNKWVLNDLGKFICGM
jgi:hypothetical protein